jgi:hypothetical protein
MAPSLVSRMFALFAVFSCLLSCVAADFTCSATVLVIAADSTTAFEATEPLNGYGIPTYTLLVPQAGVALPALSTNTSSGQVGNYGAIVIIGQVSYNYGTTGYQSALTTDQWNALYAYQLTFGVRMVQLDVYPGPAFGATALGGCCDANVEQLVYVSDSSAFSQAAMVVYALYNSFHSVFSPTNYDIGAPQSARKDYGIILQLSLIPLPPNNSLVLDLVELLQPTRLLV